MRAGAFSRDRLPHAAPDEEGVRAGLPRQRRDKRTIERLRRGGGGNAGLRGEEGHEQFREEQQVRPSAARVADRPPRRLEVLFLLCGCRKLAQRDAHDGLLSRVFHPDGSADQVRLPMPRSRRARVPFPALCVIALLGLLVPPGAVPPPGTAQAANAAPVEILTFHGDLARTGWNPDERALTPATVRSPAFGRLWSAPGEGGIYAEPLVAAGVPVGGTPRTVVYAVTERDLVYAFDAADGGRL